MNAVTCAGRCLRRHLTRLLVCAGIAVLSGHAAAVPIVVGNTGADWKKTCATAAGGRYGCCQGKFKDCTSTTKAGTTAYGKCQSAYRTCTSKKETRKRVTPAGGASTQKVR